MTLPDRKPSLPIDALIPGVLAALRVTPNLVIEAAAGAGKTTRIPPALLDLVRGDVVVLEPRRIAARMAARRVAWEMGEQAGETVGYQVRFEEAIGPKTRLRFITEGVLTRRLLKDSELKGVDAVVLDEFHERHLETDLSLALLRRLQRTSRPALKIIVMSATLDTEAIATHLDNCPVLRSAGRAFPLSVDFLGYSPEPLHVQVRSAVARLLREQHRGHTLAFLPGAAEIRCTARECDDLARSAGLVVMPLHGDLSPAEQDRVVAPSAEPKLILATNIAESSVTIDGVTAVIDSGLARIADYSHWSGLRTLRVGRISKASAQQRAGRAGRTAPGRVLRMFSEVDFAQRPQQDPPEILRADLSQLCLVARAMGIDLAAGMEWLDPPPAPALAAAELLLDRLGATGSMATRLAAFPLPPRLARAIVDAVERGVGEEGCLAAALLSSGAPLPAPDLLTAMDRTADPSVTRTAQQLRRIAGVRSVARQTSDDPLLLALLRGFPDRVARRRSGRELLLASGISAELQGEPPAYEFMLVLDAEDRSDKPMPLVRATSRIEPDWLIDLFPDRIRETTDLLWNRTAERVEAVTKMLYEDLLLQEWRDARPASAAAADLLAERALEAGLQTFLEVDAMENLQARIAFAGLPPADFEADLRAACTGLPSPGFAELRKAAEHLVPSVAARCDVGRLRELAPPSVRLKAGRTVPVHYETGKPPWIASRMQDFFGMEDGPRIGPGRTPVVLHLLGPNGRPVQQTSDLRGFWQRLYPEIRREMMRRYPRHAWPEKPV